MLLYPGTTHLDHTTSGYSFTHNFFSDLGRTVTFTGEPNFLSSICFILSVMVVGFSLTAYFSTSWRYFHDGKLSQNLSRIGSILGMVSGICFVGVALTPDNLYHESHMFFVHWGFRTFLAVMIIYGLAILTNRNGIPKTLAFYYLGFALICAGYVGLMVWGPGIDTPGGLIIQVVFQKITVYSLGFCIFLQARGLSQYIQIQN